MLNHEKKGTTRAPETNKPSIPNKRTQRQEYDALVERLADPYSALTVEERIALDSHVDSLAYGPGTMDAEMFMWIVQHADARYMDTYARPEYESVLVDAYKASACQRVTTVRQHLDDEAREYGYVDGTLQDRLKAMCDDAPDPFPSGTIDGLKMLQEIAIDTALWFMSTDAPVHCCSPLYALERIAETRGDDPDAERAARIAGRPCNGYERAVRYWEWLWHQRWTIGTDTTTQGERKRIETFASDFSVIPTHKTMTPGTGVITTKPVINSGKVLVDVGGNAYSELYIMSDLADAKDVFIHGSLTPQQELVADAVFTLYLAAEQAHLPPYMTDQMIFAHLPGTSNNPTPDQIETIQRSMWALRHLEVIYKAARELVRKGMESIAFNDTFLAYKIMVGIDQYGNEVRYYDLSGRTPIALDIALKTQQILMFSKKYLQIPGRMDDEKRYIAHLLAHRVGRMNNANEHGKLTAEFTRIKFESVLQAIGNGDAKGNKASKLRGFCKKTLDHFRRCGWIDDFAPIDIKGRPIEANGKGRILDYYEIIPKGGRRKTYAEKRALKKAKK